MEFCEYGYRTIKLGNCDKFYFTFEFEVWIYKKLEEDQIPIQHHLSN